MRVDRVGVSNVRLRPVVREEDRIEADACPSQEIVPIESECLPGGRVRRPDVTVGVRGVVGADGRAKFRTEEGFRVAALQPVENPRLELWIESALDVNVQLRFRKIADEGLYGEYALLLSGCRMPK